MAIGLPRNIVLAYMGRRLILRGELRDWTLDIVDEDGEQFLLPLPGTDIAIPPDVDWLLRENREGHLLDPTDPYALLGGRRGEFLGLDRDACVARDPKAAWKYEWTIAALKAGMVRSERGAKELLALETPAATGPKPKWRSLLRWMAALVADPHRRIGNLVSIAGREMGQSQLPPRVDLMVHEQVARYWTPDGDPFKFDVAARVVGEWDEMKAAGVPDIGENPPSEECVRRRINRLQCRTAYAARYGEHAATRYYAAKGEPVGAEHVLERVTLDGVVFKHVCLFSDDWPIAAARMKGVYAMDWVSSFVFPGATFTGPFRSEVTVTALLGVMTEPRLKPEDVEEDPRRAACYGPPDQLHPDNEKALLPPSMVPGLTNIVSYLELPKVYHSNSKAKHERFHRFLKGCLSRFRGQVFGPSPSRDPRYDPLKSADVTRVQYVAMVEAAIRAWNERPKKALGWRSPLEVLYEGLRKRGRRGLPGDQIERNLSRTVSVVLTNNGVEFDHIRYRFNERGIEAALDANVRLTPFADRLADTGRCELTARVWDNDLDHIEVYDAVSRRYHRLWSIDPHYSAGLTRYEHREYHRMLTAGKGVGKKKVDRLRKRKEFLASRDAEVPKMPFRARTSSVTLMATAEMRLAAGRLGRSKAYGDLLVRGLPTDIGGADRVDEPKAPTQASRRSKAKRARDEAEDDVRADHDPKPDPDYPLGDRDDEEDQFGDDGGRTSIWSDERPDDGHDDEET